MTLIEYDMKTKKIPGVRLAVVLAALCIWNEGLARGQSTQSTILVGNLSSTEASFLSNPPSPARNNFTVSVGFQFQVSQPITVTSLGRYYPAAGGSHTINLWASSNTATPLVSALIPTQTTLELPSFIYTTITPVTLNPGTVYAIAINESAGGDFWVDDWVPGINGVGVLNGIFTKVVAAYGTKGSYPSATSTVGGIYDTPAMIFTTNVPLLDSGVAATNVVAPVSGTTTIVTASTPNTPMMYFMRSTSGGTPSVWPVGSYIGPNGDFDSNASITLAGNAAITVPYSVAAMMALMPDVPAGIIFETSSNAYSNYAYGVLDAAGNFRFSQQYDGAHCWGFGANANESLNDVCLARPAPGTLEVNSGTVGKYAGTEFKAGGNVLDTNGVTLVGVTQPVCSASLAGKLWYSGHTTGVKDSAAICAADATNTFAWRTLY
jgi:hypothetical protein